MVIRFFVSFVLILMSVIGSVSAETIHLSTFQNNPFSQMATRIITEAYRQTGLDTDIHYLPSKRALKMSSNGEVDGEVSRIYAIGELYPSLIRVDMPYMTLKGMAFVIQKNIQIKQRSDLRNYKVGSLRGAVFSDEITKGMNVTLANTPVQLLKMLVQGRVDVIVTNENETKVLIADQFQEAGIVALDPPLIETPIYHYIHESKSYLAKRIEEVLRNMIEQGEIVAIGSEFLREHNVNVD